MSRKANGAAAALADRSRVLVRSSVVGDIAYHAPRGLASRDLPRWRKNLSKNPARKG